MKTVGFIGAYDKTDLIIYIAKILQAMNKKVLVIDATILQKSKYIVPTILPTNEYVTTFEEVDIAVGFYNLETIKNYLEMSQNNELDNYDYVFIDTDTIETINDFKIKLADKNYFVTGFDGYSLKRGIEIIKEIDEKIPVTKVLFSKNLNYQEEEYFNFISLGAKAEWSDETIYFPYEQGDGGVIIENQMVQKIKLKKLTQLYKESLMYIVNELLENEQDKSNVKKVFKQLEKGV